MTTNGGINIYDPVTRMFSRHPHDPANPQSLSSNFNNQILADRSGVLWVATFGGGLNKYNPYTNAFNHYFSNPVDPNSLSYNNVLSFFEDRQGTFWVGTSQGLNKFDKQKASFTRYYYYGPHKVVDVNASEIHCMADAENGRLWLGTYNGLKKFDPATGIFQDCEKQFPGSDIQRFRLFNGLIAETPDKLWTILNADPFLGRFNPLTGAITPHFKGMENGYLANTALMEKDTLWVGTSEGLFCMHTVTGEVTTYRHDPADAQSLSHTSVYSLYRDKKGVLWVGTAKGLNRVVSGKAGNRLNFRSYGTTDGLPDEQINGILEDDAGFLWISTMKGLARFDPDKQSCRNYTYLDGLQDNIFNAGAAWKNPKTGELFFGGPNGFNSFHPEKIIDDTIAPPVVFTDFQLLNTENDVAENHISTLREVHVRWADKAFVIRFAALNFTAPEQNQYAIMMEGFENAWRNIGNTNEATYTNLSPGRYTFRVKAANKDGVWNLRGAAITIVVLPPWWRTWWAYSLYALLLAGLFLFLRENNLRERNLQIRLNLEHAEAQRLKELNDAKSTFLTTVSHELRTPLTSIMGFSKIVQKRLAEKILPFTDLTDPKRAKTAEQVLTNLDIMVSESERLTNLINQVLDLAKIEAGKVDWHDEPVDVGDILNRAVASTSFLFEQNSIAFSQTVEPDLPRVFGDRDRLTQVVVNLLSNAAKFTTRGAVTVSAKRLDPDTLQISVADTGCGIPAKDLPFVFEKFKQAGDDTLTDKPQGTGLGLSICKEIIERNGGHIQVESTVGEGSVFSLTLPVMANQPEA
jgi:signal transduction histidine kinase